MRVDRRRYVRDLALAYAQGLNALADVKNPKFVFDPSSPEPLPTRDGRRRLAAGHLWCGSKSIITASNKQSTHGRKQWRRRHTRA